MLRQLKSTASGHDGLPAYVLKELAPAIALNLSIIFNTSISKGVFPHDWKKANIAAVWKGKGVKMEPANYRPISVLPVLARVF